MKWNYAGTMLLILFCGATETPSQNQSAPRKVPYTMAEYNAFTEAASEKSPDKRIERLDGFVSQFPSSGLLIYAYPVYYTAYAQQRDFAKVFEFADKLLALGDQAPATARFAALCAWTAAYNSMNSSDPTLAAKARDRSLAGIKLLSILPLPYGIDEQTLVVEKNRGAMHLYVTAAAADFALKHYAAANDSIKAMQALDTYDPKPLIEPRLVNLPLDGIGH